MLSSSSTFSPLLLPVMPVLRLLCTTSLTAHQIYIIALILVWGALTLLLMDSKHPVWQLYLGTTVTAGVADIIICALLIAVVPAWN